MRVSVYAFLCVDVGGGGGCGVGVVGGGGGGGGGGCGVVVGTCVRRLPLSRYIGCGWPSWVPRGQQSRI